MTRVRATLELYRWVHQIGLEKTSLSIRVEFAKRTSLSFRAWGRQAEIAKDCCEALGATQFTWATDAAERAALWAARHSTYYAALALRPGAKGFVTDACVPLSLLGDAIAATVADVEAYGVVGPVFGHAGDGNFHCILSLQDDES